MELAVIGMFIYLGAVIACSQKIIDSNQQSKANRVKEELEAHNLKMKMLKMEKEKKQLEGKNKCHNVSVNDLYKGV